MKRRNPFVVFVLSIVTLGIYDIYWLVVTKKELNQKTRVHTPTIWLLFAPIILLFISLIISFAVMGSRTNTINGQFQTSASTTGANITALLASFIAVLIILPVSFYWFWKFSKAVNEYTNGKSSTGVNFLLLWLVHLIGVAIIQDTFNEMLETGSTHAAPVVTQENFQSNKPESPQPPEPTPPTPPPSTPTPPVVQ